MPNNQVKGAKPTAEAKQTRCEVIQCNIFAIQIWDRGFLAGSTSIPFSLDCSHRCTASSRYAISPLPAWNKVLPCFLTPTHTHTLSPPPPPTLSLFPVE